MTSKIQPSMMCLSTISTSAWSRRDSSQQINCHSRHLPQLLLSSLRPCTTCHSQHMQGSPPPTWSPLLLLLFSPRLLVSGILPMPCRPLHLLCQCLRQYLSASTLEWKTMQPGAMLFQSQLLHLQAPDLQESSSVRRNLS